MELTPKEQHPDLIAREFVRSRLDTYGPGAFDYSRPVTVQELYSDDRGRVSLFDLASGHNIETVLALAAGAPHFGRGRPLALVITANGTITAYQDALDALQRGQVPTPAQETGDELLLRTTRVAVVTRGGLGGAIALEPLTDGADPVVSHGRDTADDDLTQLAPALFLARQVVPRDRQAMLAAVDDVLARSGVTPPTSPDDLDALPADVADELRALVGDTLGDLDLDLDAFRAACLGTDDDQGDDE